MTHVKAQTPGPSTLVADYNNIHRPLPESLVRDPLSVKQLMHRLPQNSSGTPWLARLQCLTDINRALPLWCDEPWIQQIRVANIREQTVVIFSASASALVPLRHRSGSLLEWLNDRFRLSCTRLEAKVRPPITV